MAKTLAEHQVEALSGALGWAEQEIERLRQIIAEVKTEVDMHASCMGDGCSIRDDIEAVLVRHNLK